MCTLIHTLQRSFSGVIPQVPSTLVSLNFCNSPISLDWSINPRGLCLLSSGTSGMYSATQPFYMRSQNETYRPKLSTEPSFQSLVILFFSCIYLLNVSMFVYGATRHGKHGEVQSLLLLCGHSGLGSGTLTIELCHWSNTVFYKVVLSADKGHLVYSSLRWCGSVV